MAGIQATWAGDSICVGFSLAVSRAGHRCLALEVLIIIPNSPKFGGGRVPRLNLASVSAERGGF